MKKIGTVSWVSLALSMLPVFAIFMLLRGYEISLLLIGFSLFVSIGFSIIALYKQNEKNIIPLIAFIISFGVFAYPILIIVGLAVGS
ncbi:hypothetical protein [Alkalibacillus almallahensis]|uniref:hypothetical protein n=1 Tax=Alkalibacillus almallahensis TaxID=1379154 RepID=UPI0014232273|nr:hypothetical protein [Alkalibacillus almallahensis]NIK10727.1 hypothetical protein [Alkalibacillus almallahensis]